MTEASHVERIWLALSVAQLWCVSVGIDVEEQELCASTPLAEGLQETPMACRKHQGKSDTPAPRRLSCVVRGRLHILARVWFDQPLPLGHLRPQAWPTTIDAPQKPLPPDLRHGTKTPREKERRRRQKRRAAQRSQPLS